MPNCKPSPVPAGEIERLRGAGGETAGVPADTVLSIERVAKMFGVSRLTLRYYELRGLIRRHHTVDRVRVFGWADCERLAFIIKCRRAGLPLGDIITIIDATDDDVSPLEFKLGRERCAAVAQQLDRTRRTIDEALAELNHVHALLSAKLISPVDGRRQD
jgi:DNA-binding transcriptional MerR regulator